MFEVLFLKATTGEGYPAFFLHAVINTVGISLLSAILATVIAVIVSVCLHRGSNTAAAFVQLFRNVPLIVQVFFCFYVLPMWITPLLHLTHTAQVFCLGSLALTLYMGSRMSAHLHAGLLTVKPSMVEACKTLGMSTWEQYRYVLLPLAFRQAMPTLTNEYVSTFKNSAVISSIGLFELAKAGQNFSDNTSYSFLGFIIVILLFIAINSVVILSMNSINKQIKIKGNL